MGLMPLLPLVGTIHKVIGLGAFTVASVAEAVSLGHYAHYEEGIVKQFARKGPLVLVKPVNVYLIKFDRNTYGGEQVAWMSRNNLVPIEDIHLYGIGIQHPEERYNWGIVALGTQRRSRNLIINGDGRGHRLVRGWANGYGVYDESTLFGALYR
jgi:hypothetical protein